MLDSALMLSLRRVAAKSPDRLALIVGGEAFTYSDLQALVLPRARWMKSAEVTRLAVVAERSGEAVFAMFAAIEAGIPLVLLHPGWSQSERQAALSQIGEFTLIDESFRFGAEVGVGDVREDEAREDEAQVVEVGVGESHSPFDDSRSITDESAVLATDCIDPELCLAVVFTSGSTGRPRGVVLSRRALIAAAESSAAHLGWRRDDRWLVSLPLAHLGGFSILLRCLMAGRCAVVAPNGSCDASGLLSLIEHEKITLMSVVPSQLDAVVRSAVEGVPSARLRAVLVGGAACPRPLALRAQQRGWPILLTYGMTETCGQVATQRLGTELGDAGVIGPSLAGVDLCIEEGEIVIGGAALLSSILGMRESPFDARGRFHSGDLGRMGEDGLLRVLGRADERINSGGEKVHPAEVEDVILRFDGIAEACVVGLPHDRWGQVVVALVCWIAGAEPQAPTPLSSFLEERLAPWKRPQRIESIASLPRTPTGKVDRRAVTAKLIASNC